MIMQVVRPVFFTDDEAAVVVWQAFQEVVLLSYNDTC